ncbi:hypothetical protein ACHAXA_002421 [Cyclostephanos tholiformis]|uniref:Uncharacterized protein n=1 Tax=Cyclostephanos tholiformis TaxID=382380 RepID=A0ABD3RZZ8_9STRA
MSIIMRLLRRIRHNCRSEGVLPIALGFMRFEVDVGVNDLNNALEETFRSVFPAEDERRRGGDEKEEEEEKRRVKGKEEDGRTMPFRDDAVSNVFDRDDDNGDERDNGGGNDNHNHDGDDGGKHENSNSIGRNRRQQRSKNGLRDTSRTDVDEYWNWSPSTTPTRKKTTVLEMMQVPSDASSSSRSKPTAMHDRQSSAESSVAGGVGGRPPSHHVRGRSGHYVIDGQNDEPPPTSNSGGGGGPTMTTTIDASANKPTRHKRHPSSSSSKATTASSNQAAPPEGDNSTIDTDLSQNSIFAATSEYIITGHELANQTITVSTHGMHILSRPTIIEDTRRYERNSLLFAVGFVLRRDVDPRQYWPALSNLSSTLRDMEVESEFLSCASKRQGVQIVLEDALASLNSSQGRCHLLLDDANLLGLRLFRPPPPPVPYVPDHAVPILLRPDWQLQTYDWDLTINWIVPHIDGIKHVRQIAASTEVDMDMVRACLRVLRHHNVLAHVDVFRYRNVYEWVGPSPVVARMGGRTADVGSGEGENDWLDEAFWYSVRAERANRGDRGSAARIEGNSPNFGANNMAMRLYSHMSSLHSLDLSVSHSSTARWAGRQKSSDGNDSPRSLPRSFPSRSEIPDFIKEERSNDEDHSPGKVDADGDHLGSDPRQINEMNMMKKALAQMYSSCNRNETFGDMLLGKIEAQMNDASETKTIDKSGKDDASIDWKLAFDYFDHRRLITFGVVRGVVRRVHQFPLAYAIETDIDEVASNSNRRKESIASGDGESDNHVDDASNNSSERHFSAVAEDAAFAAKRIALDENIVSASYTSPLLQGIVLRPPSREAKCDQTRRRFI